MLSRELIFGSNPCCRPTYKQALRVGQTTGVAQSRFCDCSAASVIPSTAKAFLRTCDTAIAHHREARLS